MKRRLILIGIMLGLLGAPCHTVAVQPQTVIDPGQTVAVLPLTYYYQVVQDYTRTVIDSESYLKGYFRENGRDSSHDKYSSRDTDGEHSSSYRNEDSSSSTHKASGRYDLKGGSHASYERFQDRTIVEKKLDSQKFTGMVESALSEAGIRLVDRRSIDQLFTERKRMSDPEFAPTVLQKATKARIADHLLSGHIESYRLEGIRNVPDGTGRRLALGGVVKVSIKLLNAQDGTSSYARTITGRSKTTFDINDPVPCAAVMDEAMDDLTAQIVASVTGADPVDLSDDREYQDSPGKRLRQ